MNYLSMIKYMFNKKTKGPIQLIHFVTSRCNARCEHCFYWKNLNQNNDLTLDEIKKITKTLPDLRFLLISGGEPFLRKDLTGIISSYCDNTKTQEVSIPTNGLLKEKIVSDCKTILNKYPKVILNIVISLDGPKESHNKIRGVDCYDKAIETFNEIKKLKIYSNFKLSIVSTLMLSNQEVLIDFYKQVKSNLKPDVYSVNLIRSNPRNPELKGVDINKFKELLKLEENQLKGKGKIRNLMHKIRTKIIIDTIEKKKYILPCYAAALTGVLAEDGKVYPCEMLSRPIAKIQDFGYDMRKVWASKSAQDYRKSIRKTKCFCTHECFLRINILFNPKYLITNIYKRLFRLI